MVTKIAWELLELYAMTLNDYQFGGLVLMMPFFMVVTVYLDFKIAKEIIKKIIKLVIKVSRN